MSKNHPNFVNLKLIVQNREVMLIYMNIFLGDEEFEDHFDDLLDDFPAVPKSPEKAAIKLPESPQKALFEDFMF